MLISDDYKSTIQTYHKKTKWGETAPLYLKDIVKIAEDTNNTIILDYGSGHGSFRKALEEKYGDKYTVIEYDPGFESKQYNNVPSKFLVCVDVLEHIEPDLIDNVLLDMKRCMTQIGFVTTCTRAALAILPDGRNAHLIIESADWWEEKISNYFEIILKKMNSKGDPTFVIRPKT
jgi:hypothetical protein